MAQSEGHSRVIHIDPIERHLLLEGIFLRYGHDFRQYAVASLNRRLADMMGKFGETHLLGLLHKTLHSPDFFRQILPYFTINTTEFFRDPSFFKSLREQVLPVLKTYPSLNVWIAGCSTGEELYSLAILLKEEGLYSRATIYATDINPQVLRKASDGIYDLSVMQSFARNYVQAGGKFSPSDYYTAEYGLARFDPALRENVMFSEHNLATDEAFVEAHLILCRNVLIYFSRELQHRVHGLFLRSLAPGGYLGLGSKETLRFSNVVTQFNTSIEHEHIYRAKRHAQVPSGESPGRSP